MGHVRIHVIDVRDFPEFPDEVRQKNGFLDRVNQLKLFCEHQGGKLEAKEQVAEDLFPGKSRFYVPNKWDSRNSMEHHVWIGFVLSLVIRHHIDMISSLRQHPEEAIDGYGCPPFLIKRIGGQQ